MFGDIIYTESHESALQTNHINIEWTPKLHEFYIYIYTNNFFSITF
jgi:hypothetical protein